jgi:AcrR family transcriptional regulator
MPRPVKSRSYDASGRRAASAETRQRIVDAARELMLAEGYRATTIAAVAKRAQVNVDTVYALVGRKPVLMRELVEQAISGSDHAIAAEERAHIQAIQSEPDAATKLAMYARAVRVTHGRLAPLFVALRDASATEPDARELWQAISERRAKNMRKLVRDIERTGALRPGLTIDEAADTIWVTNSPEVFVMLTGERGWSPRRYERWLATTWQTLLLAPAPPP